MLLTTTPLYNQQWLEGNSSHANVETLLTQGHLHGRNLNLDICIWNQVIPLSVYLCLPSLNKGCSPVTEGN